MKLQPLAMNYAVQDIEELDFDIPSEWLWPFPLIGKLPHISQLHLSLSVPRCYDADIVGRTLWRKSVP